MEIQTLAMRIIPLADYWHHAARQSLIGCLVALSEQGRLNVGELGRLAVASVADVALLCEGREGGAYIQPPDDQLATNVVTVMQRCITEYLKGAKNEAM